MSLGHMLVRASFDANGRSLQPWAGLSWLSMGVPLLRRVHTIFDLARLPSRGGLCRRQHGE